LGVWHIKIQQSKKLLLNPKLMVKLSISSPKIIPKLLQNIGFAVK